jgi:GNAT superfamily N-acetyltransferase
MIAAFTPGLDRAGFRCGDRLADKYFRAQGAREAAKGVVALFVLTSPPDPMPRGFYVLSGATVLLPDLLGPGIRGVSRYPALHAARLSRLCVDRRHRRQGLGRALLEDALERLRALAAPPVAVIADAPTETARCFYAARGFVAFAEREGQMFLPLTRQGGAP